jgi:hypothetical protein
MNSRNRIFRLGVLAPTLALAACSRSADEPAPSNNHAPAPPAVTNRVDLSPAVRQNLGVTFARVEPRAVAHTIRVPGRFELLSDARREYRTILPGRIEGVVTQFQQVKQGDLLYTIQSPRWREMQQQIAEAESAIQTARASSETIGPLRAAHRVHEESLNETVTLWTDRIKQLDAIRQAGGGKADELAQARATLATSRADLAEVMEKDAELEAREREISVQLASALARRELLLSSAAAIVGITPEDLAAINQKTGAPNWRSVELINIRSIAPGVVESVSLTLGAWAEESALVLTTVRPQRVRIHAEGLQSDLGRLRDGLKTRIVPPAGGSLASEATMSGPLLVGLSADPDQRTIDLYVTPESVAAWARPGVAASIEVVLEGGATELAVPLGCVVRDGLTPIIFRRDPKDADKVIRMEADLGIDDGRWVVIKSGVKQGDEIVLDGVYQLMLATSGSATKGGHFHADGTFHEGEDK